jgi:glyceraldehyde 3-phosphate dehydrogenase
LKGILACSDRPLVSMDFKGDPHSAIVDTLCTLVLDRRIVKVVAWYDNEWGYSCRLGDLVSYVASRDATAGLPVLDRRWPDVAPACDGAAPSPLAPFEVASAP